jgi:hypothetical protein
VARLDVDGIPGDAGQGGPVMAMTAATGIESAPSESMKRLRPGKRSC